MKPAHRPALASASMLLCLALAMSACSGGDEAPSSEPGESQPSLPTEAPPTFEIETRTTIGRVVGRLAHGDRKRIERTITDVVQPWFNSAYVGGDYPRGDFHDAFPGFTPGARDQAQRDRLLMSNKGIGARISDVTPTESRLRLDVLAVRKRPVSVTARFLLRFRTDGDLTRKVALTGRLFLTRQESGWRIFGYDVAKGVRA